MPSATSMEGTMVLNINGSYDRDAKNRKASARERSNPVTLASINVNVEF